MKNSVFYAVTLGCALLVIGIFNTIYSGHKREQELRTQIHALNSRLTIAKNEFGEVVATNEAFAGSRKDLEQQLQVMKQQDSTIRTEVSRKTRQVILLTQEIQSHVSGKTQLSFEDVPDTHVGDISKRDTVYPVYHLNYADPYKELVARADRDSFKVDLKVKDKVELNVEEHSPLFGQNKWLVTAISKNPDSKTKELTALTITPKKGQKLKVGFWGFALGVAAGLFAHTLIH